MSPPSFDLPVSVPVAPASSDAPCEQLVNRLLAEMGQRWGNGEQPRAEEYLDCHPELRTQPEQAVQLICEEICLREEHGVPVNPQEVLRRFPQWRDQLAILLECHQLLQPAAEPKFPEVGETLAGFRLIGELGRGLQGRVFLATQPALADRPVVLKVTPCDGQEHLSLARLQHTYISPLYLAQDEPDRNLRLLCMPYFGGASLARVLEGLAEVPVARRSGRDLVRVLDGFEKGSLIETPTRGPSREFLGRATYVQAVCWIGACLADGLHYAHERGLVHLDVKPSNVLLAADGQPLLLDFHLAQAPLTPDGPTPDWLGGTPPFMSPEQESALEALRVERPIPHRIDARSDIFSLGLLLYEALGGTIPEEPGTSRQPLRFANPQVSVGLADLIDRCLHPAAEKRYPDAGLLAADLRRHLIDQPLKGVPNRSWDERWRKWRRSKPHALKMILLRLFLAAALAAAAVAAVVPFAQRVREAQQSLVESDQLIQEKKYVDAEKSARYGQERIDGIPFQERLQYALEQQTRLAQQGQTALELHTLADRVRLLFNAPMVSGPESRAFAARCRSAWDARRLVLRDHPPENAELAARQQADLLDLAILCADLRVRLAEPAEVADARTDGLKVLAEAEAVFGPSPVLYRERQAYAAALGQTEAARAAGEAAARLAPRNAWEHYATGRQLLRAGDVKGALPELEEAVRLRPQDFWPNFLLAGCYYRLGQPLDAAEVYRVCISLTSQESQRAECYYNRGLAHSAAENVPAALRDFDEALRLDHSLGAAALNRGILRYKAKRYDSALTDFREALKNGAEAAACHYHMALVHVARENRNLARESVREALKLDPGHKAAAELLKQLAEPKR